MIDNDNDNRAEFYNANLDVILGVFPQRARGIEDGEREGERDRRLCAAA